MSLSRKKRKQREALAALREIDWRREHQQDLERLQARLRKLLVGVVNEIRGKPPRDTLWGYHDVIDLVRNLKAERDQLRAGLEAARAAVLERKS